MSQKQILDVRLADDFEAVHLKGAHNNCVYEVDFEERLADTAPAKDVHTLVYGQNARSSEATMALEKLERLGYTDAQILKGGLDAMKEDELVRGTPLPEEPPQPDGHYTLDLEESSVTWTGRNVLSKHSGTVAIESGELGFQSGHLLSGKIVLDLTKMTCTDLAGSPGHDVLINHLQGHDFFDIEKFPKATLTISGGSEQEVTGELNLKGITRSIAIPIAPGFDEQGHPATQASFQIDRTEWNIIYGSKRFFHRLAGHLVNDLIEIDLCIVARP